MAVYRQIYLGTLVCILVLLTSSCIEKKKTDTQSITLNPRISIEKKSVEAKHIISPIHTAQVGKQLLEPALVKSNLRPVSCEVTCDMFVPRQAVVHFNIPKEIAILTPTTSRTSVITRLDITAVSSGFDKGNFATIELTNIEPLSFTPQSSAIPINTEKQVLLNQVTNYQIVPRAVTLPVFRTQDIMIKEMSSMPLDAQKDIQIDISTGSLNQVRVLGRSEHMLKGKPYEVVSVVGLAPGMSYQFRVVNKSTIKANTVATEQCHIPVCPADFVQ